MTPVSGKTLDWTCSHCGHAGKHEARAAGPPWVVCPECRHASNPGPPMCPPSGICSGRCFQ